MLRISNTITIPDREIEIRAVRAQGPGGQNVNKVASAVHLRFDILASSLPPLYKERLCRLADGRITADKVVVIKAGEYRSQEKNREAALARLQALVQSVGRSPKPRRPTRPSAASKRKRMAGKVRRSRIKVTRKRVTGDEAG
jgi:ribosome-associated protein